VFGDRDSVPRRLAGLIFLDAVIYPDARFGVGFRYAGPGHLKADTYLYDLGVPDVPDRLDAPQVLEWFSAARNEVTTLARQGKYLDLEIRDDATALYIPADATTPLCLCTRFSYRQAAGSGIDFNGKRVSHLALRTDRGYINKIRYTYPDTDEFRETGQAGFILFLSEWTSAVQDFGEAPSRS